MTNDEVIKNLPFVGVESDGGVTFALTGENAGHWVEGHPTHVPMSEYLEERAKRERLEVLIKEIEQWAADSYDPEAHEGADSSDVLVIIARRMGLDSSSERV